MTSGVRASGPAGGGRQRLSGRGRRPPAAAAGRAAVEALSLGPWRLRLASVLQWATPTATAAAVIWNLRSYDSCPRCYIYEHLIYSKKGGAI